MFKYVLRRLALIPLTLFGIMFVNFIFAQIAPGGPVEYMISKLQNGSSSSTARIAGTSNGDIKSVPNIGTMQSKYRGARGLDPELIKELEHQFGFDVPASTRFFKMMKNYLKFDFGKSFYQDTKVIDLIIQKMPVSMSLGIWTTLLIYFISIPLGISKAVKNGSKFDILSDWTIVIGYAVPAFVFAMALIVLFCGGQYFSWFPLRGLYSDNFSELTYVERIKDYFWHLVLPVVSMVAGGFAGLTMLTKNSFLEEISKQYVLTAKAKGLEDNKVLYGHVFRNAMLIVIAGFPSVLIGMLFTGSVLIEVVFSLDGIGLLGFESVMNRDYPVVFGTLYLFGLIGLVLNLVCDLTYHLIDPRIDFEGRYGN
ncbi:MAG: microcin C ABC transporter permease YejB [Alphaproteobacteria bacterium]|nr:microcin C ABC transporter permease YejB [Alphaproteobacteria bacterium]